MAQTLNLHSLLLNLRNLLFNQLMAQLQRGRLAGWALQRLLGGLLIRHPPSVPVSLSSGKKNRTHRLGPVAPELHFGLEGG